MGCDIHGYIEVRERSESSGWDPLVRVRALVYRPYSMFAKLFGVRNGPTIYLGKEQAVALGMEPGFYQQRVEAHPVAEGRGIPDDADYETRREYEADGSDVHSPSWLLATEYAAIDWTAEAAYEDAAICAYRRSEDGALIDAGIAKPDHDLYRRWRERCDAARAADPDADLPDFPHIEKGTEVEWDGIVFRGEPWTWGRLRDQQWGELPWMLGVLSERYGAENVRMVVWFDN